MKSTAVFAWTRCCLAIWSRWFNHALYPGLALARALDLFPWTWFTRRPALVSCNSVFSSFRVFFFSGPPPPPFTAMAVGWPWAGARRQLAWLHCSWLNFFAHSSTVVAAKIACAFTHLCLVVFDMAVIVKGFEREQFYHACQYGYAEVIKDFCHRYPGEVRGTFHDNMISPQNMTWLHHAVRYGYDACCKVLLDEGADIEAKDGFGRTPLFYASKRKVLSLLLSRGANANVRDNTGKTALHRLLSASSWGFLDKTSVRALVLAGANVNATDQSGKTPLWMFINATLGSKAKMANLDIGLELVRKRGQTRTRKEPMAWLFSICVQCLNQNWAIWPWWLQNELVRCGAEVEAKTQDGNTALHIAAQNGRKEVVHQLLELGAKVNTSNKHGHTPLMLAG